MSIVAVVLSVVLLILVSCVVFVIARLGFAGRCWLLLRWDRRVDRILDFSSERHGERPLVELVAPMSWHERSSWSAPQLLALVMHVSSAWKSLGLSRGDRIAIFKENGFDYFIFSTAAIRIGAIAVPINQGVEPSTVGAYLARVGARVLVTDRARLEALGDQVPPCIKHVVTTDSVESSKSVSLARLLSKTERRGCSADRPESNRPIYIVHTSGTTAPPKGVIIKAVGMAQSLCSIILFNMVSPRDVALFALPMNHQVSQLYVNGALLMGVKCVIADNPRDPDISHCIERVGPSVFFAFPVTYTLMKAAGYHKFDFDSIRIWGCTADACHESFQRALVAKGRFFRDLGVPLSGSIFVDGLGSSEVGIAALLRIATPWTRVYDRRVGRKTPLGPEIKIVDARGNEVDRGKAGRLMVRGVSVFQGYWNAHDTFYKETVDDWFFTGDVVMRAHDGEFIHLDRAVDVIHAANGPVYTLPIEEVLLSMPGILDVSVFGVPLRQSGKQEGSETVQVPVAVVAFEDQGVRTSLDDFLNEVNLLLEPRERLGRIWTMPWKDFPLGATGKTLKRHFRSRYSDVSFGDPAGQGG